MQPEEITALKCAVFDKARELTAVAGRPEMFISLDDATDGNVEVHWKPETATGDIRYPVNQGIGNVLNGMITLGLLQSGCSLPTYDTRQEVITLPLTDLDKALDAALGKPQNVVAGYGLDVLRMQNQGGITR